jgi:stage II sporulation protein D
MIMKSMLSAVLSRSGMPASWAGWLALSVAIATTTVAAPAQAEVELRVAIEENVKEVVVGSSSKAIVRDGTGRSLGEIAAMNAFTAQVQDGKVRLDRWQSPVVWVEPTAGGYVYIGDRWYRGRTLVVPTSSGLTAVNYVDLEAYLYSVLGGEMSSNWPAEALKAQAIAARSYALHQRQKSRNGVFDLGDTAAWQVYRGIQDESSPTQAAVNATRGQVLVHGGQIIEAVFHSASGGHTENVEDVWVQPLAYLRAVPDYDQGTPGYQWSETFTVEELSNRISGVGKIVTLKPERTTPRGRIVTMQVVGETATRSISGETLRNDLGLRSTLFKVVPVPNKDKSKSAPVAFQFEGRGFGHGLGMSQWGAYNLAKRGVKYQQIVQHYFKGATLARIQVK